MELLVKNEENVAVDWSNVLISTEPELLNLENVKNIVYQDEGPEAKLIGYSIQPYSDEKLGFLASHKQLRVTILKPNSSIEETKLYFVKAVPNEVPTQAEYVSETKIFIKEVLFFNYIVPELDKFYPGERWAPKCYLAHNEVIVLEELQSRGFSMREKLFDEESINAALSALARMHAASLGAEARLGKPLIEIFPEAFQETGIQEYGKQLMWFKAGVKVAVAVAEQLGLDASQIPEACQEVFEANKPSRSLQNVVSHSDPWSNNFMFNKDKPPLCYVVDFQLVRYSPPGYDIAMLLYLTASQKLREVRGEAMVSHYYSTLCETLAMYDPPIEPPSFSDIVKGMEEQKLGALVTAMIYLPTVLLDGALGATVMNNPVTYAKYVYNDRRDVVLSNMKRDTMYDSRIKEVVTELHEFSKRLHNLPMPC
ncbi:uncharacterized protein LOC124305789 isoform X1 [Neodiprion virginianus]|uniref:uncharacterized protein LOC124183152 isoform X1 n=1 Tax=Neodiprion fabricii TaxID=2872261 RepID=UPI001ED8FF7B|nr:uncharacterized protein LOC124183152 isoform X1 [Neodiprion fabricii]XP_046621574.1 uncharacterized protein LOC124305789 isoform X1 [Neodiprion virginianus]